MVALVQVAHRGRLGRGLFTAAAPTKLEEWHFVFYPLQSRLDDVFFVPLKTLYSPIPVLRKPLAAAVHLIIKRVD